MTARILIVEDEKDLADLLQAVLEDEGYAVAVDNSGDCFDLIERFQPRVILCDYMLPRYDGYAILRRLQQEGLSDAGFVLISAAGAAAMNWQAWGADDFLAKPFDIDHLLETVERMTVREVRGHHLGGCTERAC